jgi:hypothetical protein
MKHAVVARLAVELGWTCRWWQHRRPQPRILQLNEIGCTGSRIQRTRNLGQKIPSGESVVERREVAAARGGHKLASRLRKTFFALITKNGCTTDGTLRWTCVPRRSLLSVQVASVPSMAVLQPKLPFQPGVGILPGTQSRDPPAWVPYDQRKAGRNRIEVVAQSY